MAVKDEKKLYYETGVNPNYDAGQKPSEDLSKVAYDNQTDYMALMNQAAQRGDYTAAYNYERQRNAKIAGEGLNMPQTETYARYNPETRYSYDPSTNPEYTRLQQQQNAIFNKIMNMGDFKYDAESDPVYQQYKQQYMQQGQRAMRDTMGQAAALTGGYGNTYAQQAGEQAYAAYLSRLNDVLPELYGDAYNRYRTERSDLLGEYNLLNERAGTAYERGYNDWSTRLGLERADEQTAYERRMNEENTAYAREQSEVQNYRSYLVSLISAGYMPTAEDLARAGMTQAQANALYNQYLASFNTGSGGGRSSSGGGRRRSGGSSGGSTAQPTQSGSVAGWITDGLAAGAAKKAENQQDGYEAKRDEIAAMMNRGASYDIVKKAIEDAYKNGEITAVMRTQLMALNNARGGGFWH